MKTYYQLLDVETSASPDAIKHAFRQQIARYHPDKVQHLGKEFQDMAAERAAELTHAYSILSDQARRLEYDQVLAGTTVADPQRTSAPPPPPIDERRADTAPGSAVEADRASRDVLLRQAAMLRFRQALEATTANGFDTATVAGFDAAALPKTKLFARSRGTALLVRFVPGVDGAAVAAAWAAAAKWAATGQQEVCILLMGASMSSARELADAIADQRRRHTKGGHVTLVPMDVREWHAHIPTDAPPVVRTLVDRLRHSR